MPSAAEIALQQATKDLLYMSETDEPFKVVRWERSADKLSPQELLALSKNDPAARVEEQSLDEFFEDLTADEADSADQYKGLLATIKEHLTDPRVFRIGQVQIGIYILGESEGAWRGVKTKAVET